MYLEGRSRTLYVPQALAEVTESHLQSTNDALLAEIALINLDLLKRRALG